MKPFVLAFTVTSAGLLAFGCARTQMTERTAVQVSNHFAEHLGYHLADYKEPTVEIVGVDKELWFFYQPKVPLCETNVVGDRVDVFVTNDFAIMLKPKTGVVREVKMLRYTD